MVTQERNTFAQLLSLLYISVPLYVIIHTLSLG